MLTRIKIENFRSLRNVDLEMKGLTVLIGPNGGGKSNLLDVFALMAEAATGQLSDGIAKRGGYSLLFGVGGYLIVSFGFDLTLVDEDTFEEAPITYKLKLRISPHSYSPIELEDVTKHALDTKIYYLRRRLGDSEKVIAMFRELELTDDFTFVEQEKKRKLESSTELAIFQVKDRTTFPLLYQLLRTFEGWRIYRPIPVGPDAPMRSPQIIRADVRLASNGSNLVSALHTIQSQYPVVWTEICEIITNVYPNFRHLTFPAEGGDGKILLRWWEEPFEKDFGFSANLLSDGTLRLLCLIAILKSPNPPPLICIEEPEIGLHPDWIKIVAELLESAATRTQVIVSTHSPELVSHVQPQHVVVVEKENGESTFTRLKEDELSVWLDKFRLGDLWLSGEIGGRP